MLFMIVFSWQDLNMSSHWNFLTKWPSFLNHFRFKIITKRVKITLSRFWAMTSLTDWWKDLVLNGTRLLRNANVTRMRKNVTSHSLLQWLFYTWDLFSKKTAWFHWLKFNRWTIQFDCMFTSDPPFKFINHWKCGFYRTIASDVQTQCRLCTDKNKGLNFGTIWFWPQRII